MLIFYITGIVFLSITKGGDFIRQNVDLSDLIPKLPPMISRDHVETVLGGVVSSKTLANMDSLGTGPKRMRSGRKIVYRTEDLLEWLSNRTINLN